MKENGVIQAPFLWLYAIHGMWKKYFPIDHHERDQARQCKGKLFPLCSFARNWKKKSKLNPSSLLRLTPFIGFIG